MLNEGKLRFFVPILAGTTLRKRLSDFHQFASSPNGPENPHSLAL